MSGRVVTGLDRIAGGDVGLIKRVKGKRCGLVAHPASIDRHFRHALDVLRGAGADVVALFGPEHGYGGEAQDMVGVGQAHTADGVPIHSLYGDAVEDLAPTPASLAGIDLMVVDLQDVGSRYYTYVWTAALVLKQASAAGIPTLILDRPNPLGGVVLEGAPQRDGYRSFVGLYDVPVRHGLTVAEVCRYVCSLDGIPEDALEVASMQGWSRTMSFDETQLPWVLPSPNMPTLDIAWIYPGGCLLEGTNLSEGRGCTRPFEVFGAPFVDGGRLAADVSAPGVVLRPLTFTPTFHKHAGLICGGVQVHVTERAAVRSFELYLRVIAAVAAQGTGFGWRTEIYEFVDDRPAFDLLNGGPEAREAIEAGGDVGDLLELHRRGAAEFSAVRAPYLLYT